MNFTAYYNQIFLNKSWLSIPASIEPPVRTLRATLPVIESHSYLFHVPLDNEPLMACILASTTSLLMNNAEGLC